MGVNRLYPLLPGQDGDLARASYRSFPPAFRIQNREREGEAWGCCLRPLPGNGGSSEGRSRASAMGGFWHSHCPLWASHTQECPSKYPLPQLPIQLLENSPTFPATEPSHSLHQSCFLMCKWRSCPSPRVGRIRIVDQRSSPTHSRLATHLHGPGALLTVTKAVGPQPDQ